jgi:hypothetical protein
MCECSSTLVSFFLLVPNCAQAAPIAVGVKGASGEITYTNLSNGNDAEPAYGSADSPSGDGPTYSTMAQSRGQGSPGEDDYADLEFSGKKKRTAGNPEDESVIYSLPTVAKRASFGEENYAAVDFGVAAGGTASTLPPKTDDDTLYSTVDTSKGRSAVTKIVSESTGV